MIAREPRSSEVIEHAMRYFELHSDDIDRYRHVLRSKAGVPYFVVSQRYQNNGDDRALDIMTRERVPLRSISDQFRGQRLSTVGILAWDMPVTVMTDAEFQTYQLALVQRRIISTVNAWLYSRRMLMIELLVDPPRDPRAYTSLRLRFEGFTALIDLYTGGWYHRQLPEIPEALRTPPPALGAGGEQGETP